MASGNITYLGHSSIRLTLPDERVILIDPWLKNNPSCPAGEKNQPRCDFIALTHGHADHTEDVPDLVKQHAPKVVTNFDFATILESKCGGGQFCGMNLGGTQELGGVKFSMTRAFHSSSYPTDGGQVYAGMPGGFVIEAPGLATVYHAGDTDVFSDMKLIDELYAPKVLMLPIGVLVITATSRTSSVRVTPTTVISKSTAFAITAAAAGRRPARPRCGSRQEPLPGNISRSGLASRSRGTCHNWVLSSSKPRILNSSTRTRFSVRIRTGSASSSVSWMICGSRATLSVPKSACLPATCRLASANPCLTSSRPTWRAA